MNKYSLRYGERPEGDVLVDFEAVSVDAAMKFVRANAQGDWAVLYEQGKPVCRLQAMGDEVWRVARLEEGD